MLDMSPQGSCRKVLIEDSESMYYRVPSNVASFRQTSKITVPQATVCIKYNYCLVARCLYNYNF